MRQPLMGAPHGPDGIVDEVLEEVEDVEVLDDTAVVVGPPIVELVDDDELLEVGVVVEVEVEVVVAPQATQQGSVGSAVRVGAGVMAKPATKTGGVLR